MLPVIHVSHAVFHQEHILHKGKRVKRWGELEKLKNIRFSNTCKNSTTTLCDQGLGFFAYFSVCTQDIWYKC